MPKSRILGKQRSFRIHRVVGDDEGFRRPGEQVDADGPQSFRLASATNMIPRLISMAATITGCGSPSWGGAEATTRGAPATVASSISASLRRKPSRACPSNFSASWRRRAFRCRPLEQRDSLEESIRPCRSSRIFGNLDRTGGIPSSRPHGRARRPTFTLRAGRRPFFDRGPRNRSGFPSDSVRLRWRTLRSRCATGFRRTVRTGHRSAA